MTQEEFIKLLDYKGYSYEEEGDKIVVTHKGNARLESLTSLPPDVEFRNEGDVWLDSLTTLPPGVEFSNSGYIDLDSLSSLPPGTKFRNGGNVWLRSLIGVVGGLTLDWKGNIEGINTKRLLNKMIELGLFDR